jgi:hypothetical protein
MARTQEELDRAIARGRRPAIFMFQPHRFERVTPDRLLEWEHSIANYFGLPSARLDMDKVARGATWSDSGEGNICADDSDYHAFAGDVPADPAAVAARLAADVAAGRRPTVFMWQISRFILVTADRLTEWERHIRQQVGLPLTGIGPLQAASIATLSATLPNDCMDDSDMGEP